MPSTSVVSQVAFENFGPLTTTFEQAPSCATVASNVMLAFKSDLGRYPYIEDCTFIPYTDCLPSHDPSRLSSFSATVSARNGALIYHSPGLYCPKGWSTVGVAVKEDGGSLSTTGIFNPTSLLSTTLRTASDDLLMPFQPMNVLMEAMDRGETAALCCPSSMSPQIDGFCYSTLPNFPITQGCLILAEDDDVWTSVPVTMSLYGTTVTANIVSFTDTGSRSSTTVTETLSPDGGEDGIDSDSLVAVSLIPMVTLIHRASETPAGGGDTDDDNAASGRGGTGIITGLTILIGVWTVWWMLGVGLFLVVS